MSASADLIQRQLDAYNAHDIEAFMACYAEDAQLAGLNGAVTQTGHDAIRARHLDLFAQHPQLFRSAGFQSSQSACGIVRP